MDAMRRFFLRMKIRHLLYLLIGLLGLVALAGGIFEAGKVRGELRNAEWIATTNHLTDLTLRASSIMAMERGITSAIVAAPGKSGAEMFAEMQRQRDTGDQHYQHITSHSSQFRILDAAHPLSPAFQVLAVRRGEMEQARNLVDQVISGNSGALRETEWIAIATQYIEALSDLRRAAAAPIHEEGHAYAPNTLVKETLYILGEFAGRERAIVGAAIAQNRPLSRTEREKLGNYRNTVEQELHHLHAVIKQFPASPGLSSAMRGLSSEFLGRYQGLREQIYRASEQNQRYPLAAADWYQEATRGIDSIIAIADAISEHIEGDVTLIQRRASLTSILVIIAIAAITILFILATLVIQRRIIRPLHRLEQAAQVMATGDLSQPVQITTRDELGSLAQAYEHMRTALLTDIQERETSARELRKLSQAVEQSADAIIITTADHIIEYVNPAFVHSRGYSADELIGQNARILKTAENEPAIYREMNEALREGRPFHAMLTNQREDGSLLHEEMSLSPMRDPRGEISHYVYTGKDVTDRVMAERELRKLTLAIEHSVSGIVITDITGKVEYVNPQFTRVSGYSAKEVVGHKISLIKSGRTPLGVYKELWKTITSGQVWEGEILNRRKSGEVYWEQVSISPVRNEQGEISNFVGIQHDISARKEMEDQLNRMAFHDELTQLPNRALLARNFEQAATQARRDGSVLGIVSLDLSRFKVVNDSMGHEVGDKLLRVIAQRLLQCAREHDTVARFSGDEFVILLTRLARPEDITQVVKRILEAIADPIPMAAQELQLAGNAGASLFPQDGDNLETLMRNATAALHHAKRGGRNQFRLYTEQLNIDATEQLTMENELRRAISEGALALHYQPQLDIASGRIVGVEALVRWPHPTEGMIPPVRFIPLAEETGLIIPLGLWVLREACRQNVAWQQAGLPAINMAVNLSALQLRDNDLVEQVQQVLTETRLAPRHLELELTESAIMERPTETIELLRRIKTLGVELAVDDFGTGYSSLSYLRRFPFDTLKIDRSFVSNITTTPDDAAIARTIIAMAHSLRLKVVAEGVETEAQAAYLRNNRCDELQGYLFSPPVPADKLAEMLREGHSLKLQQRDLQQEKKTVLLVDDEENILQALRRQLTRTDWHVITATSPSEAFNLLATHGAGVVISDQRMPEMHGLEFLARVAELYPETIRMVLSSHGDLQTVTQAVNQGVIHKYFSKPWDEDELREQLDKAFKLHSALKARSTV